MDPFPVPATLLLSEAKEYLHCLENLHLNLSYWKPKVRYIYNISLVSSLQPSLICILKKHSEFGL